MPRRITKSQARRLALAAQGFADPRPKGRVDIRHLRRVFDRIGILQLDSVNVLERSHYLPLFARLGPYPKQLIDDFAYKQREVFEHWAHMASWTATEDYPLLRPRMESFRLWKSVETLEQEHPGYIEQVFDEVANHGPISVGDLDDPGARTGPWWGHGKGKYALEWLFARGRIAIDRRENFTRYYTLPENVIPRELLDSPVPDTEDTHRRMLLNAARWTGVGTAADLADYYRIRGPAARPRLAELVAGGLLEEVTVDGWKHAGYMLPETTIPRSVHTRALLSPFDSLIWFRDRAERVFDFRYRIEIYVPEPKRVHGYYVLPFLLGDHLVGRVDLKSDRQAGVLRVRGAYREDGIPPEKLARELAEELHSMAGWLGLDEVAVEKKGDLSPALRKVI